MNKFDDMNVAKIDPHLSAALEKELKIASKQSGRVRKQAGQRLPGRYDANAEPEGEIHDPDALDKTYHGSTGLMLKDMTTIILKHYPGWAWTIQVNEKGRMFDLFNHHLHTEYAYRIRMEEIMYNPMELVRITIKAGGEMLERFGMPIGGFTPEAAADLSRAVRDIKGNCVPDISDLADKKAKQNAEILRKIHNGDIQIFDLGGQKMARIKT